jgi:hypothetical protein
MNTTSRIVVLRRYSTIHEENMEDQVTQIERNFTYHAPKPGQPERYTLLREKAKELAMLIVEQTPRSREQSLALTHVEDASMWANAAIARNE